MLLTRFRQQKVSGGALLYTLLILMVLGVLLGIFLLRFRLHSELNHQLAAKIQATENAISAANYFLAVDSDKKGSAKGILFGTPADSFWIQTEEWGIYRLLHVKARHGTAEVEKICLVGMEPTENLQAAIFLNDNHQPLKIVGKTKIVGNAYLPQSGLQVGHIGNRTFEGDSLIRGKIKKSASERLNLSYKNLSAYFSQLLQLANTGKNDDSAYPFNIHTYVYNNSNLVTGVIAPFSCIISTQALEISGNANADLCVFYAPSVHIKDGFRGNIQVFATDSIVLSPNVYLSYPSSLVVSGNVQSSKGLIKVHENSIVEGAIINHVNIINKINTTDNYSFIAKNAKIKGQLITNGKLELKGDVTGLVVANSFQLSTPAAVYLNHLLDIEIDYRQLSPHFATGTFVANNPRYKVITWLK